MEKKMTVFEAYNEFLKALCGYDLDFYQKTDCIVKVEGNELCFYEDISRHGSPCYERVSKKPLTPYQAEILETMLSMKKKVEQVDAEKRMKELEEEKAFIERKMEDILRSGKINYTEI